MVTIRPETERDYAGIRNVNRIAFDNAAEANLIDALRDGGFKEVSLVADLASEVIGHIFFSRVKIVTESPTLTAVSLAPMAVHPNHQRQGIGSLLVDAGLKSCRDRGFDFAIVLGHPNSYQQFEFSAELATHLASPFDGGDEWMAHELIAGSLSSILGEVIYPPPSDELE
ncbi:GNAT family N-acetyltransferase [Thalassoroseus pseudoceratinae]|uniref:GNAT family N-acetyltransferase n=1 Tax=Thalassoroseus pseudoceratinae TaxID=2713176 RepID=UPI001422DE5C|nr:N-acetyltransferase [Thalassoroseus pseudoceratinae]